jgi:hypothetical protein
MDHRSVRIIVGVGLAARRAGPGCGDRFLRSFRGEDGPGTFVHKGGLMYIGIVGLVIIIVLLIVLLR